MVVKLTPTSVLELTTCGNVYFKYVTKTHQNKIFQYKILKFEKLFAHRQRRIVGCGCG